MDSDQVVSLDQEVKLLLELALVELDDVDMDVKLDRLLTELLLAEDWL